MKLRLFVLLLLTVHPALAMSPSSLRAFIELYSPEDLLVSKSKGGILIGEEYFMLFQLRDGKEFGRQVPAVWVSKEGYKWKTIIISDDYLLESKVENISIRDGDLYMEFSRMGSSKPLVVRLKIVVRDDLQMVFLNRVGIETLPE